MASIYLVSSDSSNEDSDMEPVQVFKSSFLATSDSSDSDILAVKIEKLVKQEEQPVIDLTCTTDTDANEIETNAFTDSDVSVDLGEMNPKLKQTPTSQTLISDFYRKEYQTPHHSCPCPAEASSSASIHININIHTKGKENKVPKWKKDASLRQSSTPLPGFSRASLMLESLKSSSFPLDLDRDHDPWCAQDNQSSFPLSSTSDPHVARDIKDLLYSAVVSDDVTPKEQRIPSPYRLKVTLLEHQKLGLEFMLKQEMGRNRGGILADDMGLGKTIQALSICLENPSNDFRSRATLIVAPISLIYQWEEEIKLKVRNATVYIHHGQKKAKNARFLNDFDFILTSYGTISSEWPSEKKKGKRKFDMDSDEDRIIAGPLFQNTWHRVILDEAHIIKNRGTRCSISVCKLEASYRWCLTGTPIQNSVSDLYSLIRFLRITPYNDYSLFKSQIGEPMAEGRARKKEMDRLRFLVKSICLRRRKTDVLDGAPLIILPDEKDFYDALEKSSQLQFNQYLRNGTVMQHYSYILVLILRLRQAACHPDLVIRSFQRQNAKDQTKDQKLQVKDKSQNLLANMPEAVQNRLLQAPNLSCQECPICLDAAQSALILQNCGHIFCKECIHTAMNQSENGPLTCPNCRGPLLKTKLMDLSLFLERFKPEEYQKMMTEKAEDVHNNVKKESSWMSSTKIEKCIGLVLDIQRSSPTDKVIIFSQFLGFLDLLETPLKNHSVPFLRFDGATTMKDRDTVITSFKNDPSYKVILISLKCGSLGLNLTCANHVILCDFWWNPAIENQAIDRVHRLGQSKNVSVHRLYITGTIEDRILALQEKKQKIADSALGDGSGLERVERLSIRDLMSLFDVHE